MHSTTVSEAVGRLIREASTYLLGVVILVFSILLLVRVAWHMLQRLQGKKREAPSPLSWAASICCLISAGTALYMLISDNSPESERILLVVALIGFGCFLALAGLINRNRDQEE